MVFHSPDPNAEAVNIWETPSLYATAIESTMRTGGIVMANNGDVLVEVTPIGLFCAKNTPNGGKMVIQVLEDEIRGFSLLPGEWVPSGQLPIEEFGDHTHDRNLKAETIATMLAKHIAPMVGVRFEDMPAQAA